MGMKEWILENKQEPKIRSGIYFLIKNDEIVYVGQSINVMGRIGNHTQQNKKDFDSYTLLPCRERSLDALESRYIFKFQPKYNKIIDNYLYKGIDPLKIMFNINKRSVRKIIKKYSIKTYSLKNYNYYKVKTFERMYNKYIKIEVV